MARIAYQQELYSGLLRFHILHHAAHQGIFGLWIIEELARHGYILSPGTLYPTLHKLEREGYLRSSEQRDSRRIRRVCRATPLGRQVLRAAKKKVRKLPKEISKQR
jgi:DNA-binding PadR family transcriptional regulator